MHAEFVFQYLNFTRIGSFASFDAMYVLHPLMQCMFCMISQFKKHVNPRPLMLTLVTRGIQHQTALLGERKQMLHLQFHEYKPNGSISLIERNFMSPFGLTEVNIESSQKYYQTKLATE